VLPSVAVEKSGFATEAGSSTRTVSYGIVLRNTSSSHDAWNVDVTVNILDGASRILESDSMTIEVIPAESPYYHGGSAFLNASDNPARLEIVIQVREGRSRSATLPPVANVRLGEEFGEVTVQGEVINSFDRTLSSLARITGVVLDQQGNVIGGDFTFPSSSIPPGQRIGFTLRISGISRAQAASAQVSVEPEFS
jgi:hypothetical protein